MSTTETEAVGLSGGDTGEHVPSLRRTWASLWRNRRASVGLALVGLIVAVALSAPLVAPHSPAEGDLANIRPGFIPGPSADHPLGLDHQGRDELSRLLHGARSSLVVAVGSVALSLALGIVVAGLAVALGRWIDTLLMGVMDVMLAIPGLLFAIGLAALLGPSLLSVSVAIGLGGAPVAARLLRATMLTQRERDYVLAAAAMGATRRRVVLAHLLPNSVGPVLVASTLALGGAILTAAGLSFLGLGPNDPTVPEWGRMLAESQGVLATSPRLVLLPGTAIALAVLGFNLLADGLRDLLDPRTSGQRCMGRRRHRYRRRTENRPSHGMGLGV